MPVRQHLDTLGALPFEGGAVIHEEWLRAGLVMCLYRDGGGRMVDMVSGARPTTDTATLVNSISGPVTAYTGTQVTEWPYSSAHALHGAVTLIVGYSVTSFTNYTMLVARASGAGSNNSIELRHNGSTSTDFAVVRASAGGAVASFYSFGGSSATGAHTAAVRFASGDLQEIPAFWRDGVLLTTNGTGTTGTAADAGTTRVGRRVDGVCQLDGSVGFVFGFARALTNQQVQSLMRAPGLLFARPRAGMIGGSTAITLNGVVGNATAAGTAAQVGVSITANGTVGNATAAGTTAQVGVSTTVNGVVGNATAAGTAAQVGVSTTVNGVVGNATAAGTTAQVGVSTTVNGVVGNATAAGTVADVQLGGVTTINGAVGAAVAAGVLGAPGVTQTINGAAGAAVAAGTHGTTSIDVVLGATTGNADAAGTIAQVGVSVTVDATPGSAAASGLLGALSLDIAVPGVVAGAVARGTAGDVSLVPSSTASAAEVWSYVLSNGLTAEQTFVAIHSMLSNLHLIHGLAPGSPLTVTPSMRSAGAVLQSISQAGDTVTVTRS